MSTSWEYLEPVRVADRLRADVYISDIFHKAIRLDSYAVWIVTETRIRNEHDVLAVRARNTVLVHRAPKREASRA